MKFPFDFSVTLIFRLIFPGMVLALAFLPLFAYALKSEHITVGLAALIPCEAVVLGWLVVLLDQPIYMLYEGRRYWPNFLRTRLIDRQTITLARDREESVNFEKAGDIQRMKEVDLQVLDYPLDNNGEPKAEYPTRLGNLLRAYETYPRKYYGIDTAFYWYRLWVALDKDLRESMDQAQAMADSAIYVSFAFLVSALAFIAYAGCYIFATSPFVVAHVGIPVMNLPYLPPPLGSLAIAVGSLGLSYFTYSLGLHAQRQYGEFFKALFDQFRDKLDFAKDAAALAVQSGAGQPEAIEQPHVVAARFLRFHRIRPLGQKKNLTPEEWAKSTGRTLP